MHRLRILLVEDDALLRDGLADLLAGAGHSVEAVEDGESAVSRGLAEAFDLVVLDVMLPGLDGNEVCKKLRHARPALAILMVTALGSEDDKVRGLLAGADDHVTKPFGPRELLARVEALARRLKLAATTPEVVELHGTRLDLGRREARIGSRVSALTPREAGIIRLLLAHRERAVSRAELLEHVWGVPGHLTTRTVDMAIVGLRQKVEEDPSRPRVILSVKGVGYAWGSEREPS